MESKNRSSWFLNTTPLVYCAMAAVVLLLVFSSFAILTTNKTAPPHDKIRGQMIAANANADTHIQESENVLQESLGHKEMMIPRSKSNESQVSRTRRFLGGPGSWPPRCMSKCGRCNPCKPVHVRVPPGTPVTTEYYPEAWRCKCGNRLFMP